MHGGTVSTLTPLQSSVLQGAGTLAMTQANTSTHAYLRVTLCLQALRPPNTAGVSTTWAQVQNWAQSPETETIVITVN